MRRTTVVALLVFTLFGVRGAGAVVSIYYDRVTGYTDNTTIAPVKVPTVRYQAFSRVSPTDNWTPILPVVMDNQPIPVPSPPYYGATWEYTVRATLDNATSDYGLAVPYTTPFPSPIPATAPPVVRGVR